MIKKCLLMPNTDPCVEFFVCISHHEKNYLQSRAHGLHIFMLISVKTISFNRSGASPDVNQEELVTSFLQTNSGSHDIGFKLVYTIKILNIRTDSYEQTVQTEIRLLLFRSSLITVYTVCHFICIFWMNNCIVKSKCSNFSSIMIVS